MRIGRRVSAMLAGFAVALGNASAHELTFSAELTGGAESPPNASGGHGHAHVTLDLDLVEIHVEVDFSGLAGQVLAAHVHGLTSTPLDGVSGVALTEPTLPAFPLGVTSGAYDHVMTLTVAESYSPAFIAASGGTVADALNALISGMEQGRTYLSIKTDVYPGGELRGFLIEHHHAVPGDLNCDEVVSVGDIGPFVLALTDPAGYAAQFPKCDMAAADINEDGSVSVGDIGPFVGLLTR